MKTEKGWWQYNIRRFFWVMILACFLAFLFDRLSSSATVSRSIGSADYAIVELYYKRQLHWFRIPSAVTKPFLGALRSKCDCDSLLYYAPWGYYAIVYVFDENGQLNSMLRIHPNEYSDSKTSFKLFTELVDQIRKVGVEFIEGEGVTTGLESQMAQIKNDDTWIWSSVGLYPVR
jgi:hypothetical protein